MLKTTECPANAIQKLDQLFRDFRNCLCSLKAIPSVFISRVVSRALFTLQTILTPPHTKDAIPCGSRLARKRIAVSKLIKPSKRGFKRSFEAKRLTRDSVAFLTSRFRTSSVTLSSELLSSSARSSSENSFDPSIMVRALVQAASGGSSSLISRLKAQSLD